MPNTHTITRQTSNNPDSNCFIARNSFLSHSLYSADLENSYCAGQNVYFIFIKLNLIKTVVVICTLQTNNNRKTTFYQSTQAQAHTRASHACVHGNNDSFSFIEWRFVGNDGGGGNGMEEWAEGDGKDDTSLDFTEKCRGRLWNDMRCAWNCKSRDWSKRWRTNGNIEIEPKISIVRNVVKREIQKLTLHNT